MSNICEDMSGYVGITESERQKRLAELTAEERERIDNDLAELDELLGSEVRAEEARKS